METQKKTRGIPLNERPDFMEISRRAGINSAKARKNKSWEDTKKTMEARKLLDLRPSYTVLKKSGLYDYVERMAAEQRLENWRKYSGESRDPALFKDCLEILLTMDTPALGHFYDNLRDWREWMEKKKETKRKG